MPLKRRPERSFDPEAEMALINERNRADETAAMNSSDVQQNGIENEQAGSQSQGVLNSSAPPPETLSTKAKKESVQNYGFISQNYTEILRSKGRPVATKVAEEASTVNNNEPVDSNQNNAEANDNIDEEAIRRRRYGVIDSTQMDDDDDEQDNQANASTPLLPSQDQEYQNQMLLQKYQRNQGRCIDFFCSNSLCFPFCHYGKVYSTDAFERETSFAVANPKLNLEYETQGLVVSISPHEINSYKVNIVGLIRPVIVIHAVSISTGNYIKSKNAPPAKPVTSSPGSCKNNGTYPRWEHELLIDANFSDVASEDTLLLFEIMDDKTSIKVSKGQLVAPKTKMKKLFWAYLLPIGLDGTLRVGLKEKWLLSKRIEEREKLKKAEHEDQILADQNNKKNASKNQAAEVNTAHQSNHNPESGDGHNSPSASPDPKHEFTKEADKKVPDDEPDRPSRSHHQHQHHRHQSDIKLRLQLYKYRRYDWIVGFFQRKLMNWPSLSSTSR